MKMDTEILRGLFCFYLELRQCGVEAGASFLHTQSVENTG